MERVSVDGERTDSEGRTDVNNSCVCLCAVLLDDTVPCFPEMGLL